MAVKYSDRIREIREEIENDRKRQIKEEQKNQKEIFERLYNTAKLSRKSPDRATRELAWVIYTLGAHSEPEDYQNFTRAVDKIHSDTK